VVVDRLGGSTVAAYAAHWIIRIGTIESDGGHEMGKMTKLPREELASRGGDAPEDLAPRDEDTEGHGGAGAPVHGPGTGGDLVPRRPTTGGEFIDENDVEGHGDAGAPVHGPGTGGDLVPRRPTTGGEFIDENDVEGHGR
jgi:hypothetical protein